MFDLEWVLWDNLAKALAEKVAGGASAVVAARAGRLHLPSKKDQPAGGADDAGRTQAYDEFRSAAVRFRVTLGVLASGPQPLLGALWSYPVHLRLLNRTPGEAADALDALLAVETKGRMEAIAAAEAVMLAVNEVTEAFVSERRLGRTAHTTSLRNRLDGVDQALATYTRAVRSDLGFEKPQAVRT